MIGPCPHRAVPGGSAAWSRATRTGPRREFNEDDREVERQVELVAAAVVPGHRSPGRGPTFRPAGPGARSTVGERRESRNTPWVWGGGLYTPYPRPYAEPIQPERAREGRRGARRPCTARAPRRSGSQPPPGPARKDDAEELGVHLLSPPVQVRLPLKKVVQVVLAGRLRRRSRPDRRPRPASCWAVRHWRRDPPRRTNPDEWRPGLTGRPRTRGARSRCGWAPGPAAPGFPAHPGATKRVKIVHGPSSEWTAVNSRATSYPQSRSGHGMVGDSQKDVHAQPCQMVETGDHPGEVPVPVAIRVTERPYVHLVDGRSLPPVLPGRVRAHVPPTDVIRRRPRSQQATSVTAGRARTRTRPRPCYPPHLRRRLDL